MKDKVFMDTNILVYAFDSSEPAKRQVCKSILEQCWKRKVVYVTSNQVLAEFFFALTKRIEHPLKPQDAQEAVTFFSRFNGWHKTNYGYQTVERAAEIVTKYNLPFWDALIVATMIENEITVIYTENEKDFKKMPFITVINPLINEQRS